MTQSLPADVLTAPWLRVRNRDNGGRLDLPQLNKISTDIDNLFTFCMLLEMREPPLRVHLSAQSLRTSWKTGTRGEPEYTRFRQRTVQQARGEARRLLHVRRISYNSPLEYIFMYGGGGLTTGAVGTYLILSGRVVSLFNDIETLREKHSRTSLEVERNKLLRQELRASRKEQRKAATIARKGPPPPRVTSTNKATLVDVGSLLESAGNALNHAQTIELIDPDTSQQQL